MTIKISGLPAVTSATSTDIFPVVQGGVTKRESVAQLIAANVTGSYLPLTGGTLTGDLTLPRYNIIGDVDNIGQYWAGADMQNLELVQNAQLQAMAVVDVAGNQYYHINSQTARPKFSFDIETQINTSFINTGVQATGIIYNQNGTLSASCTGLVITGTGTTFPVGCENGIIYWPSTRQYARVVTRNSNTSLNVDTSITQASAPFVLYYNGMAYNPQSNILGLSAATTIAGDLKTQSGFQWNVTVVTTLTVSQTGASITFSSNPGSLAAAGYVVPASGSPVRLMGYAGTATFPTDLSQTITSGTACTLYYFDNSTTAGQIFQQQPVTQNLFPNFQRISIGSGSGGSLSVWNHAGSEAFANGLAVGAGSTTMIGTGIASQSSTTVTASTSVFTAAHVGRLIRFAQGYTAFIRGFTSGTVVVVDVSQTVPLQSFFIVGTGGSEGISMGATGDLGCAGFYNRNLATYFGGEIHAVTQVTTATYTALTTDYVLACNRAGTIAITLIASPVNGRTYRIKDISGAAATNNITITPASGNIDGAANYVISTNYGGIDIIYTGSQWNIL